jgi:hypothetical protein
MLIIAVVSRQAALCIGTLEIYFVHSKLSFDGSCQLNQQQGNSDDLAETTTRHLTRCAIMFIDRSSI